jgi:serine protease Do
LLVFLFAFATATAQLFDEVPTDPESRNRLYLEIAQEVAALERQGNLLKKVVRLVKPTVVHIEAEKTADSSFSRKPVEEAGSGVIFEYSDSHYILTNRHVIKDSELEKIDIHFSDGRQAHPTRVWHDRTTDVAVMAVRENDLFAARMGDSDKVEIGDFVVAMGSPFGLSHSVTYGIISAKGRRDLQLGGESIGMQDFMQTDAAINPGNSGGPLMNLRGEVIGINTAIASNSGGNEGIGFTIPSNMAMTIARQLIDQGRSVRAFLGVLLNNRFSTETALGLGLPRLVGAHVKGITPGSPAEIAGIVSDDVVLKYDGVRIDDDDHLINRVGLTPVGKTVDVVLLRDKKLVTLQVRVGDRSRFKKD